MQENFTYDELFKVYSYKRLLSAPFHTLKIYLEDLILEVDNKSFHLPKEAINDTVLPEVGLYMSGIGKFCFSDFCQHHRISCIEKIINKLSNALKLAALNK